MERGTWKSRTTFILAAIGSAVGLGNAWRFPGLAAKHGGGAFLLAYFILMLVIGIPLLAAEIAIGRHTQKGPTVSIKSVNKKCGFVGWMSVFNGGFICIYYAVVFAWIILMFFHSYEFAKYTGDNAGASALWATLIKTTGTTSGYTTISVEVIICIIISWILCFLCIRNGTTTVSKVVKYTVSIPVICLIILAVKGLTMENALEGLRVLFIPDFSAFKDSSLWIDAIGQVFYSLSTAMAIMIVYGSFLKKETNIAKDVVIVAVCDMLTSILASVVMFTTMAGTNMLDSMSDSGIKTAFIIYPQAIVNLTNVPVINAIFGYVFYFCLITLAIDSLFSIVEGVATSVSDYYKLNKKKLTLILCIVFGVISLIYATGAGLAILDIVDKFINSYSLILTGTLEAIVIGYGIKTSKVSDEINANTKKFKLPSGFFNIAMKVITPVVLGGLFIWNIVDLIFVNKGVYGASDGYSIGANIIFGYALCIITIFSSLIIRVINKISKKGNELIPSWDEYNEK